MVTIKRGVLHESPHIDEILYLITIHIKKYIQTIERIENKMFEKSKQIVETTTKL